MQTIALNGAECHHPSKPTAVDVAPVTDEDPSAPYACKGGESNGKNQDKRTRYSAKENCSG